MVRSACTSEMPVAGLRVRSLDLKLDPRPLESTFVENLHAQLVGVPAGYPSSRKPHSLKSKFSETEITACASVEYRDKRNRQPAVSPAVVAFLLFLLADVRREKARVTDERHPGVGC